MSVLSWLQNNIAQPAENYLNKNVVQPVSSFVNRDVVQPIQKVAPVVKNAVQQAPNYIGQNLVKPVVNNIRNVALAKQAQVNATSPYVKNVLTGNQDILPNIGYNGKFVQNPIGNTARSIYGFGANMLNTVAEGGIIKPINDIIDNVINVSQGKNVVPYAQLKSGAAKIGYDIAGQGANNIQGGLSDIGQTVMPIIYAWGGEGATDATSSESMLNAAKGLYGPTAQKAALWQLAKVGMGTGAKVGAAFGAAQGVQDNKTKTLSQDLFQTAVNAVMSGAAGAAIGGVVPYAGAGAREVGYQLGKEAEFLKNGGKRAGFIKNPLGEQSSAEPKPSIPPKEDFGSISPTSDGKFSATDTIRQERLYKPGNGANTQYFNTEQEARNALNKVYDTKYANQTNPLIEEAKKYNSAEDNQIRALRELGDNSSININHINAEAERQSKYIDENGVKKVNGLQRESIKKQLLSQVNGDTIEAKNNFYHSLNPEYKIGDTVKVKSYSPEGSSISATKNADGTWTQKPTPESIGASRTLKITGADFDTVLSRQDMINTNFPTTFKFRGLKAIDPKTGDTVIIYPGDLVNGKKLGSTLGTQPEEVLNKFLQLQKNSKLSNHSVPYVTKYSDIYNQAHTPEPTSLENKPNAKLSTVEPNLPNANDQKEISVSQPQSALPTDKLVPENTRTNASPLLSSNNHQFSAKDSLNNPLNTSEPKLPQTKENVNTPVGIKLKESRFSNITAPNSPQVGKVLSSSLKDAKTLYTPQTEQAGIENASKYSSGKISDKVVEVLNSLSKEKGTISRQEALNAQAVALKLQDKLGNTAVEDMTAAQKQALESSTNILTQLSEHYTAAGQLSQSAAVLNAQTPQGLYYSALKVLDKVKDKSGVSILNSNPELETQIRSITNDIKKTSVGTPERQKLVQTLIKTVTDNIPRGKSDALFGFWRSMLISGPETVTKVATSYGINTPGQLLSRPISSAVDALTSLITGKRSISFNPVEDAGSFGNGFVKGAKAIPEKLATGMDAPGTSDFNAYDNPAKNMSKSSQQTGFEKAVTRVHAAIPKPIYTATYDMNIAEQARTAAMNAGKSSDKAFIKNLIDNPTSEMKDTATEEAQKATNMATNMATKMSKAIQDMPILGKILNPIAKVPANIGLQGLFDYAPTGFGKSLYEIGKGITTGSFDQRAFSTSVGKASVGTGIAILGAFLMNQGRMSLATPTDPKQKALNEAQNIPNNSVYVGGKVTKNLLGVWNRTGGKWLSLNATGAAGITMALGGGYQDAKIKGSSTALSLGTSGLAGAKLLADQPYVQGIAGFGQALSNPTEYASTFLNKTAGSVVPGLIAQPARGFDPSQRVPATHLNQGLGKNILQTIQSEIPGLREELPAAHNAYGQVMPGDNPNGTVGGGLLGSINPFYSQQSTNQNDAALNEIQRLYNIQGSKGPDLSPPTVINKITTSKLDPNVIQNVIANYGPQVQSVLNNLIADPRYRSLSDDDKTTLLNNTINSIQKNNESGKSLLSTSDLTGSALLDAAKTSIATPKLTSAQTDARYESYLSGDHSMLSGMTKTQASAFVRAAKTYNATKDLTPAEQSIYNMSASDKAKLVASNPSYAGTVAKLTTIQKSISTKSSSGTKAKKVTTLKVSKPKTTKIASVKIPKVKTIKLGGSSGRKSLGFNYKPIRLKSSKPRATKYAKLAIG